MLAPIKIVGRADLVQHQQRVRAQRVHGVVRVGGAVAVAVPAGVESDDVQTLVGQDLAGVLPGVPVLSAAVQEQDRRSIRRGGSTPWPHVAAVAAPGSTRRR